MEKSKLFYRVVIGDTSGNNLEFELDSESFCLGPITFFIDLGFIVTVHKIKKD